MPRECLRCGCCCFSTLGTYVRVSGDDYGRLGEDAEALTVFVGNRCYMRMEAGRCTALRQVDDLYVCSVYERRPQVCRDLDSGSPNCDAEIERKEHWVRSLLPRKH